MQSVNTSATILPSYELREQGGVLGNAAPLRTCRRDGSVGLDDRADSLRAIGFWGRLWHLLNAAGDIVWKCTAWVSFAGGPL